MPIRDKNRFEFKGLLKHMIRYYQKHINLENRRIDFPIIELLRIYIIRTDEPKSLSFTY